MKRALFFLTALSVVWSSNAWTAHAEPLANNIGTKQLALGVKLLQDHGTEPNTTISPYSIHAALMLARLGAKGDTAAELDSVLLPSPYSAQSLMDYAMLNRSVFSSRQGVTATLANSVWLTNKGTFQPGYLRDSRDGFEAEPRTIDFTASESARETINGWVSSKTNSLIPKLLPSGSITPATVSTLVNALYFKAPWLNKFNREGTKDETFWLGPNSEAKLPLMYQSENANYFENDSWQAVHLPYQWNEFYFLLLVPKSKLSTKEIVTRLSPALLFEATTAIANNKVNLHLPRFTIREPHELALKLAKSGLSTSLSPAADFSGISSVPVTISSVQHEAVVIVDEDGTEAAAATAMVMAGSAFMADPPQPKEVRADHPFAFAIIHRQSGAPLFLGVVGDPR